MFFLLFATGGYMMKKSTKDRAAQQRLPCLKGAGILPILGNMTEGYKPIRSNRMERKHNSALTANARNLRKSMTKEERHLWYDFLRTYPVRFLRQKVIDRYIVDFYCHEAKLVIELDGSQHYEEKGLLKDRIRTERIEERNLTVLRVPNNAVNQNFSGVCEYIDMVVRELLCR